MLGETRGVENGQIVRIYENQIVLNQGDILLAKKAQKTPPTPKVSKRVYIEAGLPSGKSKFNGPINDRHKQSFPTLWAAFEKGLEDLDGKGVSIDELHEVSTAIIEEYKEMGITNLEQILEINDNEISNFPMGMAIKNQAQGIINFMRGEATEENSERIEQLERNMAEVLEKHKEADQQIQSQAQALETQQANIDAATKENEELKARLEAAEEEARKAKSRSEKAEKKNAKTAAKKDKEEGGEEG